LQSTDYKTLVSCSGKTSYQLAYSGFSKSIAITFDFGALKLVLKK